MGLRQSRREAFETAVLFPANYPPTDRSRLFHCLVLSGGTYVLLVERTGSFYEIL